MKKIKTQIKENRRYVVCPECNTEIEIEDFYSRGDIIMCEECGAEYVLKSLRPINLIPLGEDDLDY